MLLTLVQKAPFFRIFFEKRIQKWTDDKISDFKDWLSPYSKIIDVGAGNGFISLQLQKLGHKVTPVDVRDLSVLPQLSVTVYDGVQLPFRQGEFQTALVLTVLHHCMDPVQVLSEASRVARQVVVIEDTYTSKFQKWYTQVTDTIVNLGHSKMTYQNKSAEEWVELGQKMGMRLKSMKHKRVLFFFRQTIFLFESEPTG